MSVTTANSIISAARKVMREMLTQSTSTKLDEVWDGRLAENKSATDKWDHKFDGSFAAKLERWATAKALHQDVDGVLDDAKAEVVSAIMPIFAEKIYTTRQKPSNPQVELTVSGNVKHRYQIWMTNVFTTHFSKRTMDDHVEDGFIEELIAAGLPLGAAKNLVRQELKLICIRGIRQLNELSLGSFGKQGDWLDSSEVEKRAAQKFEAWLHWDGSGRPPEPLTDLEKQAALIFKNSVEIRPGFLDRIHQYVRSPQEILAIFKLITPSVFPTRLEFGINEDDFEKAVRKLDFSVEVLS